MTKKTEQPLSAPEISTPNPVTDPVTVVSDSTPKKSVLHRHIGLSPLIQKILLGFTYVLLIAAVLVLATLYQAVAGESNTLKNDKVNLQNQYDSLNSQDMALLQQYHVMEEELNRIKDQVTTPTVTPTPTTTYPDLRPNTSKSEHQFMNSVVTTTATPSVVTDLNVFLDSAYGKDLSVTQDQNAGVDLYVPTQASFKYFKIGTITKGEHLNDDFILVIGDSAIDPQIDMKYFANVVNFGMVIRGSDGIFYFSDGMYTVAKDLVSKVFNTNITYTGIDAINTDATFVTSQKTTGVLFQDKYLESDYDKNSDNVVYAWSSLTSLPTADYTSYKTSVDNKDIYLKNDTKNWQVYYKTSVGLYIKVFYSPIFQSYGNKITITDTNTVVDAWNYSNSWGGCSMAGRKTASNVDSTKLVVTAKGTNDTNLYEYSDPTQDPFLKQVYDQDYIANDNYKYLGDNQGNGTPTPNPTPLSFTDYAKKHVLLYWKDPFGKYWPYMSANYVFVGGCAKPVVYLYPTQEKNYGVKVNIDGKLTYTDPAYNSGWVVKAEPNGDLYTSNGQKYDYLFWEGQTNMQISMPDNGWIIEKSKVATVLPYILTSLGFNHKEENQFIEYWLPRLMQVDNKYVHLTFVDEKVVDKFAPLEVTPKITNYKRYFMLYQGTDEQKDLNVPVFNSFDRNGDFLFEWGGAKIF